MRQIAILTGKMKPFYPIIRHIYIFVQKIYNGAITTILIPNPHSRVSKPHVFRTLICSLSFFVCQESIANGTCIMAIRTPTQVVVAADSLGVPFGATTIKRQTFCKIAHHDSIYFACSGDVAEFRSGFDVYRVAGEALSGGGTTLDKVKRFDDLIQVQLPKAVKSMNKTYKDEATFVSAVFFGFESGTPFVFARGYKAFVSVFNTVGVSIVPNDCPGLTCPNSPNGITYTNLGKRDTINKIIDSGLAITNANAIEAVKILVESEIAADINNINVAPPVDVISIDKTGVHWIQKKNECK